MNSEEQTVSSLRYGRSAIWKSQPANWTARYKVEIKLETPKVAFRETIRKKSDVDTKIQKTSPADMVSTDM